ncbi:hypothetical protein T440DRAFT_502842 [Plenodomus tracheiphilus IPT5]|uniref:Tautomerase cis-CaaD-like domain-containing protein n=1 Tax=Plenodomus tracheiphilus IPT5 TaxID=1408161 RepID=A0A6A7AR89_9PLEO|nr:hypothetical protein T440DRAFT_502842 [Plenodomus tracheiphilus IPT5]
MPLWTHSDGTCEDDDTTAALTADIIAFYTDRVGLPAFYVNVVFILMAGNNSLWISGKKAIKEKPSVRIVIEHIAVHAQNEDVAYRRTANGIDRVLKPHVADKGYDWEFHVDETERRLWKVQGLHAPPFKSEAEKVWTKLNKAVPWKGKLQSCMQRNNALVLYI